MWRTILTGLLAAVCPLAAAPVKIHGYLTSISSSKSFNIDDYRITRDDNLPFELDKGSYPDTTFGPEDLRVGTEMEVQGDFNDSTHELHATCIKVFVEDNLRVKRFAVIEHPAVLQHDGSGWKGAIHADGQTIKVDGQTRVVLKEGQTNQLSPGLAMGYEGRRARDGSIVASKFEVFENDAGKGERRFWRDNAPKVNPNGEISIAGARYKLTPDAEAQSYLQRVGSKLVPGIYQRDLSGGAARRLSFQFYLVENRGFNAHAFPNGVVIVNKGVMRVLANEAQLAAVLGHEIAHTTHEHAIRDLQHSKGGGPANGEKGYTAASKGDPPGNGYSRSLENQADRMGLEYMVAAGYDAREAAEVWRQVASTPGDTKSLWTSRDDSLSRRSYLLAELHNNYSRIDFQSYVRDCEEFDTLAERFGNTTVAQRAPEISTSSPAGARPGYEKPRQGLASAQAGEVSSGPVESPGQPGSQRYGSNAVTISSDPAGADVVLNGRVIGKTPLILPTGAVGIPFIITVRKAGYRNWTGQLVSVPGRTSLRVDLLPQ